jgi:hypothetical protein
VGQEETLIRVTITDREQTVSFLTHKETLLRLVAGCSVSPASLGELLIAADIYQKGIAAAVMVDLMEFDKAIRQKGADFIHAAIAQAKASGEALILAFQVIDEITSREAFDTQRCEVVAIDLTRQIIRHSSGLEITITGEVNVEAEKKLPNPTVTYILPQGWTIQAL